MTPVERKRRPIGWTLKDARAAEAQGWDLSPSGIIDDSRHHNWSGYHDPEMYDRVVELAKAGDKLAIKALVLIVKLRLWQ